MELEKMKVVELRKLAMEKDIPNYSKMLKSELIVALKGGENKQVEKEERKQEVSAGILEVLPDGFGFLRSKNYLTGEADVYIAQSQIRRFNLKTGDWVEGIVRAPRQGERFKGLIYVKSINGQNPEEAKRRIPFEKLTPIYPENKIELLKENVSIRMIDLFAPIGKGQRGMIVAPPKVGKTTLLKKLAKSIAGANKNTKVIILLIDERPEEVTDIIKEVAFENVEVIFSTFDERPEHHKRVSEMVLERCKRLVEQKKDVVVLLDSLTRLSRAYNLITPPSGRTLSGGLDPAALYMPKKFFGAARNIENGGSLTILATALTETGSKMDDVIFEEFKGTGNMELVLDRNLAEKRIFPAINMIKSGTRKEELLLSKEELDATYYIRRRSDKVDDATLIERVIKMVKQTKDNSEFVKKLDKK